MSTTQTAEATSRKRRLDPAASEPVAKRARTEEPRTVVGASPQDGTQGGSDIERKLEVLQQVCTFMNVESPEQLMPRLAIRAHELAQQSLHIGKMSLNREEYQKRVEKEGPNALIAYVLDSYNYGVPLVAMGFSFKMKKFADHVTPYNLKVFKGEGALENAVLRSRWWKMAIYYLDLDAKKKNISFSPDLAGWRAFHERLQKCWHHKSLAKYKEVKEDGWKRTFFKESFEESVWLSVQKFWGVGDLDPDPAQVHLEAVKQNNSRAKWSIDLDEVSDDVLQPVDLDAAHSGPLPLEPATQGSASKAHNGINGHGTTHRHNALPILDA